MAKHAALSPAALAISKLRLRQRLARASAGKVMTKFTVLLVVWRRWVGA